MLHAEAQRSIAVETDPAPFILGGYSFSLRYTPQLPGYISILGSVYKSTFPDRMMSSSNSEKGFRNLRFETSYAFFGDYFLKENRTGLHFGPSLFLYRKSVQSEGKPAYRFQSIYPNLRIGYLYKPFPHCGFYINPWINGGKEIIIKESRSNSGWKIPEFSYIIAIHAGYRIFF
jgi:hypothetical protein